MEIEPNGIAQWAFEDTVVDRRMTVEKPTAKLLKAVGHAVAAGDVLVTLSAEERDRLGKVESDADSLKALRKAAESGDWQVGNHEAFLLFAASTIADVDYDLENAEMTDDDRANAERIKAMLEAQIPVSEAYLDHRANGLDHENAVRASIGHAELADEDVARAMKAHAAAVAKRDTSGATDEAA